MSLSDRWSDRWSDLGTRVTSALVLLIAGGLGVAAGGVVFLLLVVLAVAGMMWELAHMSGRQAGGFWLDIAMAVLAALCLLLWSVLVWPPLAWGLLGLPGLVLLVTQRRDAWIIALYALGLMVAAAGFVLLRTAGVAGFLWLLAVVITSDVLGYFAGRLIGGPKFWPRISPKKTWSGTIAGWIGAVLVGLAFWHFTDAPPVLLVLSPLIAVAGQFGDIAESWLKRRAGIKDASNLIPGHGGLLDRFDALLGAMLAVQLVMLLAGGLT